MKFHWSVVHFALRHGGCSLVGDDIGLRKNIPALDVALFYMSDRPLIIVRPSSMRLNWGEEALKWLNNENDECVSEREIINFMNRTLIIFALAFARSTLYRTTSSASSQRVPPSRNKRNSSSAMIRTTSKMSKPNGESPSFHSSRALDTECYSQVMPLCHVPSSYSRR